MVIELDPDIVDLRSRINREETEVERDLANFAVACP